jgi:hypothetical protein
MMMLLRRPGLATLLRIYAMAGLIAAVVLSPLAFSFVPIVVLLWYGFQLRRNTSPIWGLLSEWFVFITVALLLAGRAGAWGATLIALPLLPLIATKLEENLKTAPSRSHHTAARERSLTGTGVSLAAIAAVLLMVALLVGSLSLAVAGMVSIAALAGLTVAAWRGSAATPVVETPLIHRMVAGSQASLDIEFGVRTTTGGLLFLESPDEWVRLDPGVLSLEGHKLTTRATISPSLSGPTTVKLNAWAVDRWGLVESGFELEPVQLYIIPRARYAAWLVQRYMAGTGSGTLPLLANLGMIKPLHGWRRGVEYYGSRLYQPGDSLKNIDWKHSLQHRELTAKEFAEFGGRPAIVLVNLVAGDAEEADKLAYAIISTALSLARESIPAALATYAQDRVKLTTPTLGPDKLLSASLQATGQLITVAKSAKYLSPPNVTRLRANIRRLGSVRSKAATVLTELMKVEYDTLRRAGLDSAAFRALDQVMRKVDKTSNIIVISAPGSDSDALEFSTFTLGQRGNHVITLSV